LNHQKTFDNFKEQLEDLNYLEENFNRFHRVLNRYSDRQTYFINTLNRLTPDEHTAREGHASCIEKAKRNFNQLSPNPDKANFLKENIKKRIRELTPKTQSHRYGREHSEYTNISQQMLYLDIERHKARKEARIQSIALQNISPEQRAQMRYDHTVQNNPNQSWSLPPSPNPNYDPLHVLDPDELAALPDKAINKGLKLAGKGVRQIQESDRYNKLKINVKHLWDSVKKPAEPSFMCKNGRTYSFAERWLWPKEQNEGSRRGGR
jgi:hypothetical protein